MLKKYSTVIGPSLTAMKLGVPWVFSNLKRVKLLIYMLISIHSKEYQMYFHSI